MSNDSRSNGAFSGHGQQVKPKVPNPYALTVATMSRLVGLPMPEPEIAFAKATGRKWKFDFAWPLHFVALEVEGAVWTKGRHTRGAGYIADCEKYTMAAILGWCVIRVTPAQLNDLRVFRWVALALTTRQRLARDVEGREPVIVLDVETARQKLAEFGEAITAKRIAQHSVVTTQNTQRKDERGRGNPTDGTRNASRKVR